MSLFEEWVNLPNIFSFSFNLACLAFKSCASDICFFFADTIQASNQGEVCHCFRCTKMCVCVWKFQTFSKEENGGKEIMKQD